MTAEASDVSGMLGVVRAVAAVLLTTATLVGGAGLAGPAGASQDSDEWEYVCLLNEARIANGRAPVRVTGGLRGVARGWAAALHGNTSLPHNPFLQAQLNSSVTTTWDNAGENTGYGWTVESVHDALMGSKVHRDNILDPRWEYVGVGVSTGTPHWVVQDFLSSYANLATISDPYHSFLDVCTRHPFFEEIEWMSDEGISTGYANGTYRPGEVVTRQSMAAFMFRLAGEPQEGWPDPGFADVGPTHPFLDEIAWMAGEEITTGYADNTFRPGGHVSREAMAAFMYRFAQSPPFTPPTEPEFPDVALDHHFFHEISWMADAQITTGYANGTFGPGRPVTRQAMSAFMQRLDALG